MPFSPSLTLAAALFCASAFAADGTVIVVRHAERGGGMSASVGLSDAGRCRAEGLARMLADAGVKRIFATDVERTQQTAAPLARKLGLTTLVLPSKDTVALIAKLRSGAAGETALVVGHSNTVPEIVNRLGGGTVPPIDDAEYDRLYVVTASGAVLLRYPGCTQ